MKHEASTLLPEGVRGRGTLIIGGHEDHNGQRDILKEVAQFAFDR
jgi:hypothetical protein